MTAIEKPVGDCGQTLTAEGWECHRCAFAWDDGDKPPAACSPLTYDRLLAAVMEEANRIDASQRALVASGDRKYRYQPQCRRAMELRSLARLIVKQSEARKEKAGS